MEGVCNLERRIHANRVKSGRFFVCFSALRWDHAPAPLCSFDILVLVSVRIRHCSQASLDFSTVLACSPWLKLNIRLDICWATWENARMRDSCFFTSLLEVGHFVTVLIFVFPWGATMSWKRAGLVFNAGPCGRTTRTMDF